MIRSVIKRINAASTCGAMHSVSASPSNSTDVNVPALIDNRDPDFEAIDVRSNGETEGLRILDEFRKLYESRIEKVDRQSGGESDRVSVSNVRLIAARNFILYV